MAETWPTVLIPTSVSFRIRPMNVGGPSTQTGRRQVVGSDAGYWTATLSGFQLFRADHIREWRALIASLNGQMGEVVVGPFDCRHPPWPIVDGKPVHRYDGIEHSDGSTHSDGSGYTQSAIDISLADPVALRDTSLTATIVSAGELKRGMYFSSRDRLHMVTTAPIIAGDEATFNFLPPIRTPAAAGERLNFADPKATMRLAGPDTGEIDISMGRFANTAVDLEESFLGL